MKLKEVEVPDELVDFIMEHELINTYKNIKRELKNDAFFHPDDKPFLEETLAALKVVGRYFVFKFDEKVKKK
jgi:hypothetical protein